MTNNEVYFQNYSLSGDWAFTCTGKAEPCLENQKAGKIIIDPAVKRVLESCHNSTFAEIDQKKIVSRGMLEIILKVFTQAGVLVPGEGITPKETVSPVEGIAVGEGITAAEAAGPAKKEAGGISHRPLVSVVITAAGADDHLTGVVESVKSQAYPNLEIIVVDIRDKNRSTHQLKSQYPDLRVLALRRGTRYTRALAKGLACAAGNFILVLDSHCVLEENALGEMMNVAQVQGQWSAVALKIKYANNPAIIHSLGVSLSPYFGMGENFKGSVDFGQFDHHREPLAANFSAVLLNREALQKVGNPDAFYNRDYAGLDWCFRAGVMGFPVRCAPNAVVYLEERKNIVGKNHEAENRLYFTVKNLEKKSYRRFFKNYAVEDIKKMLIYLKRRQFARFWGYKVGYLRLVLAFPRLLIKRLKMQRCRIVKEDAVILALGAPYNSSLAEEGIPRLDSHVLRIYYSFLQEPQGKKETLPERTGDIVLRQERKQSINNKRWEKCYFDYSFSVEEGNYDIYLLGFITKNLNIYLDNRCFSLKTKKGFNISVLYPAVCNVFLSEGRHVIELQRRNHIRLIIFRKIF